jgi:hypothetical protein
MEQPAPTDATKPPVPAQAGSHQGRNCAIATLVAMATWAGAGGILASFGVPPGRDPQEGVFQICVMLLGFGFCAGVGSGVTGLLAMKQKRSPLWLLPAAVGVLLGVSAMLAILGLSFAVAFERQGIRY